MRRTVPLILTLTLALAGCATADDGTDDPDPTQTPTSDPDPTPSESETDGEDPDPTPSPTDDDDVAAMPFDVCETEQFSIGYPAAWETNGPGGLVDECRVFHPDAIDLPDDPQEIGLHWTVTLFIDAVPFDDVADEPSAGELLDQRSTTVDGRDAVVTEYRSDGVGLVPEGERVHFWAVDLDDETLFARTTTIGDTDYDRDREVLARMMDSLDVTEVEPLAGPASTDPSSAEPTGDPVVLTDVAVTSFTTFDRLTLTVRGDGQPGWDVAYEAEPAAQGSGAPIEVAGTAALRLTLTGVALPPDAPADPYDGPERLQPTSADPIREVLVSTVYEGRHDVFVGVDRERPFRIGTDGATVVLEVPTG